MEIPPKYLGGGGTPSCPGNPPKPPKESLETLGLRHPLNY